MIARHPVLGLLSALALLCGAFLCSLMLGRTSISWEVLRASFLHYDASVVEHIIIHTERLSRALIATATGAALAVAGALMQALTRNPLASPGVFGINSGAILFVVLAALLLDVHAMRPLMGFAFAGAALAALLVYGLGSLGRDGLTPVKLVMAGAAITALCASFTQAILVMDEAGLQDVLFWLAGSVSGRPLDNLVVLLPFLLAALAIALVMGRAINLLATGEEIARGLGQNTLLVKAVLGVLIVVLAGGAVAVVGAVGFVGLVVPHLARALTGNDYRWLVPYAAVLGAALLLLADVAARLVLMPQEVPIGVMTALIGVPFFVYYARKGVVWR
ncbi:iron ABC transporter permease [Paenibacillus sp. IB182496]|uniref:Iron ABC transporter permease n=1 Tax=Paenibacillus sabuli TaxID=2772509 RepID=A0A927BU00_9BACL|nr:iron ABC transporter permease [Paenibacillus sabuli]MBD2845494.1 iron ABC transporter permease [Paenibacillus sabuli]